MPKDPICGMEVNKKEATKNDLVVRKKSKDYFFCSKNCKEEFIQSFFKKNTELILSSLLIITAVVVMFLDLMLPFMGVVFLILSTLKLIDIKGFANMFVQYDLLASRSKIYAHSYPFIELAVALMFFFKYEIILAAVITIFIMGIGSIGVGRNLLSKNKVKCACLGAKLNIPLTRFTLVEDLVMFTMGIILLLSRLT